MSETRPIAKRARHRRILAELRASNDLWIPGLVTALDDVRHMHRRDSPSASGRRGAGRAGAGPRKPSRPAPQRQQLAALAMSYVRPHMVVMIDGGSTALDLARRMATDAQGITVITNNLPAATVLGANPTISVTFCPGRYHGDRGPSAAPDAIRSWAGSAPTLPSSAPAASTPTGRAALARRLGPIKRAMLERSEENFLLLDHTKFGRRHPRSGLPARRHRPACSATQLPAAALCRRLWRRRTSNCALADPGRLSCPR